MWQLLLNLSWNFLFCFAWLGQKQAYRKVYTVLNEAKDECTRMGTKCSAIVEREENVFTLRSTALVQENTLIYNFVSEY